jgi:DUF4097 and DUF4098 domain-containing protein YvlB
MSAAPPPYSPPPPPYSPQDQRRQARAYAQAQRDQMRAQRQYWKYWRGSRRSSIAGPVVLLAIGAIALMLETGRLNWTQFWNWYAQWWPLLLIALGVVALVEYFWDRNNPWAGRRSLGGVAVLIILLAFVGWGGHHQHMVWGPFGDQFNNNGSDFWSMFGEEHNNDVRMDQSIPSGAPVNVQNPRGDVIITASADNQIHLSAHEVVHTNSDNDAQKAFREVTPKVISSGSGVVVTVPGRDGASVDLTLELPRKSLAIVNAGHGDVTVDGLGNNVDITSGHGDVKLDAIGGDIHTRMNRGDFSAHAITGHVFMDGNADDVTLSEVKGQVVLDGEIFGDLHLEQTGSSVHVHTSRTDMEIPKLEGDLTMDSDDLTASQITGPLHVVTRSKNIELTGVAGNARVENSDGDITLSAIAPLGSLEVINHSGGVTVTVPDNAAFSVSGSTTEDNDLHTDFPLQVSSSSDRRTLSGSVGSGGPKIGIDVWHGDLELRKGSASVAETPEPPTPPAPPRGVRHLKPSGPAAPQPVTQ